MIPERKERLRVVGPESLDLVMDIVVGGIVPEKNVEGVVGSEDSAVVIHRLHCGE